MIIENYHLYDSNLKYGTEIPNATNATWAGLTTGAYGDYNNDPVVSATYGRYYNWFVVDNNAATKMASNGGKNVCPTGWHVPADEEWITLITYLGGEAVAGGKLKEAGTNHWISPNTGATNETRFTALPGGYRVSVDGSFGGMGVWGYYWTPKEVPPIYASPRVMFNIDSTVGHNINSKNEGFSVRCIKD